MYCNFFKRLIDIVVSLFSLLFLFPVFIIIATFVFFDSKGPVFYLQDRVGKNRRIFKIYKFRTMVDGADKVGPLSTSLNDTRVTRVGKFLRAFSLDELPQILNVFKGDMSLIGYRPGVLKNYSESFLQSDVFSTRPGITGLAQVSGRSGLTPEKKRELELKYSRSITFFGDVKILFLTFLKVVGARGAY